MTRTSELRRIAAADIDLVAKIDRRMAQASAHRQHIVDLLSEDMSWAVVVGEEPVGFAIVTRHFYGFPFVDLLHVAESHRRNGAGSALMAQSERVHDADRIFTSTNESNAPMRALLARDGWTASGQIDNLDPGDPELVFVKFRDRG
jgi:GNAT superfamily N-acetyltransferase